VMQRGLFFVQRAKDHSTWNIASQMPQTTKDAKQCLLRNVVLSIAVSS